MNCVWCFSAIDPLTESHVEEGLSTRHIWHTHCWNAAQEAVASQEDPDEREDPRYWRGQTLADVGMCAADFR